MTTDREITISRHIAAQPALVFDAWTDPQHADRWMGPRGFTTHTTSMDVRPGGEWRYLMRHPEHGEFPNRVRYLEVVPFERLVYDHDAGEGDANPFRVTVTFAPDGAGGTLLVMRSLFPTVAACEAVKGFGAVQGGEQTVDKLAEHLSAEADAGFFSTRVVNAPRHRVWQAWTDPAQLARWWGPAGMTVEVLGGEVRPGGTLHYAMIAPPGHPMAGRTYGRFVYLEVAPEGRIAWVNSFADAAGGLARHPLAPQWPAEMLNTVTFDDHGSTTTITLRARPIRAKDTDRLAFASMLGGMQMGYGQTLDKLEAVLG